LASQCAGFVVKKHDALFFSRSLGIALYASENGSTKTVARPAMQPNECFSASVGKDWLKITNCNIHMNVKRRLQRTVIRGAEGDDLLDEGANPL